MAPVGPSFDIDGPPGADPHARLDDAANDEFRVNLDVFSGPFEVLLTLIAKHRLDITEVALAAVTDEFIRFVRSREQEWDLELTSEFLVVAATLLDLKAARLLPKAEVEDEEDLALLEARDLLFARLLQYRAYRQAAQTLSAWFDVQSRCHPRAVRMEDRYSQLLPDVVVGIGPDGLAALAAAALTPKPAPTVSLDHVHAPHVSVREQARVIVSRLRRGGTMSFRALSADAPSRLHVVARFLAVLELYRERAVSVEQVVAMGELTVRWTGDESGDLAVVGAEFDDEDDADPVEPAETADLNGVKELVRG
jgi:segregation and condensation protein A